MLNANFITVLDRYLAHGQSDYVVRGKTNEMLSKKVKHT